MGRNSIPSTGKAALKITSHVKYAGAGTLEFIVDAQGRFYFLEMNTRLQVEHPVTEWVTGVDLVAWQLLLAAKELAFPPIPARKGHAIEVRLYAEDSSTFLPAPGPLGLIHLPTGAFVRSDSAFHSAGDVSIYYDPMISKISVWASTRESAIDRLRVALDEVRVESPKRQKGIRVGALETNLTFLRKLVRHQDVLAGQTTTDLIARNSELTEQSNETLTQEAAVALSLFQLIEESEGSAELTRNLKSEISGDSWKQQAYLEGLRS
jgi:acetyl-CoA carboxylase, biotin carboxylase subunit